MDLQPLLPRGSRAVEGGEEVRAGLHAGSWSGADRGVAAGGPARAGERPRPNPHQLSGGATLLSLSLSLSLSLAALPYGVAIAFAHPATQAGRRTTRPNGWSRSSAPNSPSRRTPKSAHAACGPGTLSQPCLSSTPRSDETRRARSRSPHAHFTHSLVSEEGIEPFLDTGQDWHVSEVPVSPPARPVASHRTT